MRNDEALCKGAQRNAALPENTLDPHRPQLAVALPNKISCSLPQEHQPKDTPESVTALKSSLLYQFDIIMGCTENTGRHEN